MAVYTVSRLAVYNLTQPDGSVHCKEVEIFITSPYQMAVYLISRLVAGGEERVPHGVPDGDVKRLEEYISSEGKKFADELGIGFLSKTVNLLLKVPQLRG